MNKIPTQIENPNGFHQRYRIQKVVLRTEEDKQNEVERIESKLREKWKGGEYDVANYSIVDTDPKADYFVLRLDEGGKDTEHIKACRIGVNAYADAIAHHLPELAKDLKERYPILSPNEQKERK